ncbi:CAP domain-containing protein [Flavobacterium macacae]|uniref:CAP domain-containing protein n=1 Tax=Flavobacterium macacae TaxID=2488993 RepID=A0A3P3W206_9FLAO|nr:CAP domain-containing protein [Flavobacterium macacae]RRJ88388.1 CAP domain-containing protein [Flavobacterium macacae]
MTAKMFRTLLPMALLFTMMSCSSDSESDAEFVNKSVSTALVENYEYDSTELELVNLINSHRQSLNLPTLQPINHISYKSEEHNAYMIQNNVVNHDFFNERSENLIQVLGAVRVSENVAYNYNTPEAAMNAWLNSPGHKANIEGDFTHFGISVSVNPETGRKYYTNMFIKK